MTNTQWQTRSLPIAAKCAPNDIAPLAVNVAVGVCLKHIQPVTCPGRLMVSFANMNIVPLDVFETPLASINEKSYKIT